MSSKTYPLMSYDTVGEKEQPEESYDYPGRKLKQMYERKNRLEKEIHKLNKQIELYNQNPSIKQFFDLEN